MSDTSTAPPTLLAHWPQVQVYFAHVEGVQSIAYGGTDEDDGQLLIDIVGADSPQAWRRYTEAFTELNLLLGLGLTIGHLTAVPQPGLDPLTCPRCQCAWAHCNEPLEHQHLLDA